MIKDKEVSMEKLGKTIIVIILYLPLLNLLVLYSFFLRAVIKLGKVPFYNNPDPGELGFSLHAKIAWQTSNLIPLTILAWAVSAIYFLVKRQSIFGIIKKHFIISFILLLIEALTLTSSMMTWFWD